MQPVKSYIETYLSTHGGQVHQDLADLKLLESAKAPAPVEEVQAPVVRTPVDVLTIRAHMTSFREVAFRSVENALASYNQRQAKSKLAWRSLLAAALIFVTILVVATNTAKAMHFNSLNGLLGIAVLLTVAELCLRAQSIRRHRKTLRLHVLDAPRNSGSAKAAGAGTEQQTMLPGVIAQPHAESGNSKELKQDQLLLSLS